MVDIGNDARACPMLMMHASLASMSPTDISGSNLLNEHLSEPMYRKRTSKVIGGTAAVATAAVATAVVAADTANVGRMLNNNAISPLQKYHQMLLIKL